jgi:hypothetical protein
MEEKLGVKAASSNNLELYHYKKELCLRHLFNDWSMGMIVAATNLELKNDSVYIDFCYL